MIEKKKFFVVFNKKNFKNDNRMNGIIISQPIWKRMEN